MKAILLAVFLATTLAVSAQPEVLDYSLGLSQGGVPVPGGGFVIAPVVEADWWMLDLGAFVVRMTLPPEIETRGTCTGEVTFDPATRVLTWSDRLDNQYIAFKSCPLTFRVDPSVPPGTRFQVTATLTTEKPDRHAGNNAATLMSTILPASDLGVASSPDVRKVRAGTVITYTFTVTNYGPHDAHDVSLTDYTSPWVYFISFEQTGGPPASLDTFLRETPRDCSMPPPCNFYLDARFPVIPAGTTATFALRVRAKPSIEAADIINRIVIRSTSVDSNSRNDEAFAVAFAGPEADLVLAMTRLPSRSELEIPVTIEVLNDGPDTVNRVIVNNALHARYDFELVKFVSLTPSQGTCSAPELIERIGSPPPPPVWEAACDLGALAPGETATIAVVLEKAEDVEPFNYFAGVSPAQNDAHPENNLARIEISETGARRRSVRR